MGLFDTAASIKFTNPGDTAEGEILSHEESQQHEFDRTTGKPSDKLATWDDGSPKYQLVFQLATDRRDDDTDSGQRAVYVSSTRAIKAVVNAVRATGARLPEQGGYLKLTYTGNDPASFNGSAKAFRAEYRRPQPKSFQQPQGGTEAERPGQQQSAPQAADPWAPADAATLSGEKLEQVQGLLALKVPDQVIVQTLGVTAAQVVDAKAIV